MVSVLFVTPILAQCDWNGDGVVNVVDIVQTVDCILNDCWAGDILGCTDPAASNYDPNATVDDCSCDYGGCGTTIIDIDNNVYETIQIGDQCWMAENLKVTHYSNGDEIPTGFTDSEWSNLDDTETDAYAVYPYDNDNYDNAESCEGDCAEVYGNLYNWYAVDDTRDICPEGWHVATDDEWMELTDYLGGESVAGGKMKSTGTIENGDGLWYSPNTGATNESGFTALPGGERFNDEGWGNSSYYFMGQTGNFWSSTEFDSINAWTRNMRHIGLNVFPYYTQKRNGFSVRCVGD
ncbi:MAG: fibrobacter succinogenes major paralogous domain-containing protein [Candidatus Marinimicrobia bacterium]|nr:fibrobacter succinogenes major paralogous domain-containing protein [Candidatus Neomarinimicrobiota bacterium]